MRLTFWIRKIPGLLRCLGKTTFVIDEVRIPIFDLERTIIDTFRLLDKEIAIKALKMAMKRKGKLSKSLINRIWNTTVSE